MNTPATPPPSERGTVRRLPQRASYEEPVIHAILDEGLVAHVGVTVEGQPYVLPMVYGRIGRNLYLHGASVSRLARQLAQGVPVCLTVTLLDGLVLARSAFHHSANYRSVVALGTAVLVTDEGEKLRALEAITDHALRGRWAEVRAPNAQELKATSVLRLPLEEASAKIRTGPPRDDEEDLPLDCWAGVLPLRLMALPPVPAPELREGIRPPASLFENKSPWNPGNV
ncbi:pyridoxamine 5'-phosphate oxidase family protein [Vitiosangium sp. GDMCC 1.1324]|uniref:pyridoxamine 5'-phosphate oxidase family protein n=1 Tax=Vitiosangium sp. (strain GDMCC 1.1324) TaxID=2138576 RepID=UPI000D39DDB0|nr:pyridoxamine 5'-phosphate oxidase family protein [Vitiosangium sp. GDMCC 1.1324]PTL85827.1 pyridoxamine 5'-phosphate oxidase family protein [Vitiosangium sp. GDMCC 1.1324]